MRGRRAGQLFWVALVILFLAAIGVSTVSMVSRTGMRHVAHARSSAELLWTARAALSSFGNQLKMTAWEQRFYGGSGAAVAPEYATTMSYRGRRCEVWARDVERGGKSVPGLTDVFVTARDPDHAVSLVRRVELLSFTPTDPRAIRILREVSLRADLADSAERTRLAERLESDAQIDPAGASGAAAGRAALAAASSGASPADARAALAASASEIGTERRFQDLMSRGRTGMVEGDLDEAIGLLTEAVGIARSSVPAQARGRLVAAQLALARAEYTRGITSAEPERTVFLDRALAGLAQLAAMPDALCGLPTVTMLRAQVGMATKNARTKEDRDRALEDLTREIEESFAGLPPGTTVGGGPITPAQVVQQFRRAWSMPLAVALNSRPREGDPAIHRVHLVDDAGNHGPSFDVAQAATAHLWLPDGSALLLSEWVPPPVGLYRQVLVDRCGTVLRKYDPAYRTHGPFALTPNGDALLCSATGYRLEGPSVYLRQLTGGAPRALTRLAPASFAQALVVFSGDGRWVAVGRFGDPLSVARAEDYLAGRSTQKVALPPEVAGSTPHDVAWTGSAGQPLLGALMGRRDDLEPWRLILVDPENAGKPGGVRVAPRFPPQPYWPHALTARRGVPQLAVASSAGGSNAMMEVLTIAVARTGFPPEFTTLYRGPSLFSGAGSRASRGWGDMVHFPDKMRHPVVHSIDLAGTGIPVPHRLEPPDSPLASWSGTIAGP